MINVVILTTDNNYISERHYETFECSLSDLKIVTVGDDETGFCIGIKNQVNDDGGNVIIFHPFRHDELNKHKDENGEIDFYVLCNYVLKSFYDRSRREYDPSNYTTTLWINVENLIKHLSKLDKLK